MKQVERIYLTRGDNVTDSEGRKTDKCCAVQIEGKLYWLSQSFASPEELEGELRNIGVAIMQVRGKRGLEWKWGVVDKESGEATCGNNFSSITKHHDDVFSQDSSYLKRTVRTGVGSLWWTATSLSAVLNGERLTPVHKPTTELSEAAIAYCKKINLDLDGVEEFASLPHLIIKKSSAEQLAAVSEYFKSNCPRGKYFAENLRECLDSPTKITDVLCKLEQSYQKDTDFDAERYGKTATGSYIYK